MEFLALFLFVCLSLAFFMFSIGFLTLEERHMMGLFHLRKGPNKISLYAIMLFFFDGFKNFGKDLVFTSKSTSLGMIFMPSIFFIVVIFEFFCLPFFYFFFGFSFSMLFFLCLVGLSVYGVMVGGIFSKSKYALLGSIRAASQNVSFEICFGVSFFCWSCFVHSFELIYDYFLIFWSSFFLYVLILLAELGRAPFDFTESESELVSGYSTDYSSVFFVLFMLSEYGFLLIFSLIGSFQYFYCFYLFGLMLFVYFILTFRCSFPRYRYDFLMLLFWKVILPCSLIYLLMCFCFLLV